MGCGDVMFSSPICLATQLHRAFASQFAAEFGRKSEFKLTFRATASLRHSMGSRNNSVPCSEAQWKFSLILRLWFRNMTQDFLDQRWEHRKCRGRSAVHFRVLRGKQNGYTPQAVKIKLGPRVNDDGKPRFEEARFRFRFFARTFEGLV